MHLRAHDVDPKPIDGKCQICHQIADKKGKTRLVHANKNHIYRLPINPEEWLWIHHSCHRKFDAPKLWTPEKRKEHSDKMKISHAKRRKERKRKHKIIKNSSQISYWLK